MTWSALRSANAGLAWGLKVASHEPSLGPVDFAWAGNRRETRNAVGTLQYRHCKGSHKPQESAMADNTQGTQASRSDIGPNPRLAGVYMLHSGPTDRSASAHHR